MGGDRGSRWFAQQIDAHRLEEFDALRRDMAHEALAHCAQL
jgi:hypothetical protein